MGLDAVKLMTVHSAKGLEFPVVHFPGMNRDTLPGNAAPPACLPPNGMIAGARDNALEAFRLGNSEERECLFYVAASRARDRLFFYAVTHNAKGATRPLSPYLDRMGSTLIRTSVSPTRVTPPPLTAMAVELVIQGPLRFSGPQVALYESCPRRFLYTHVLRIGGRRTETAYMRMHEAVRSVVQAVVATGIVTAADDPALVRSVTDAFAREGICDQDAIVELRQAAVRMLRYFYSTRAGHTSEVPAPLQLIVGGEELTFLPDDVVATARGERIFRVVRTGRTRGTDADDVSAAAHLLAARQAHPTCAVELIYLTDSNKVKLDLSPAVVGRRQATLATIFAAIRAGAFPTKESDRVCPGCPAFFVCGQTPNGRLERKF
jgi:hypothetical protein